MYNFDSTPQEVDQILNERDHYKERCSELERVIAEWLAACPTNKDGKLINFFATRAQKILQSEGTCSVCNLPGKPCVFCSNGICKILFCAEHRYAHEKCNS